MKPRPVDDESIRTFKIKMKNMSDCMALNITEFMKLSDKEKQRYLNHVDAGNFFDVRVFGTSELVKLGLSCEICQSKSEKLFGTGDEREPKFCQKHYVEQNRTSLFRKQ